MSAETVASTIFVYGTLKAGEERGRMWPRAPVRIRTAWIEAELYDLGPYPAILAGTDRVRGEAWEIAPEHLDITLRVLDEIECYGIADVDLYVRREVLCYCEDGEVVKAHTYFLADERTAHEQGRRMSAGPNGWCTWSRAAGAP